MRLPDEFDVSDLKNFVGRNTIVTVRRYKDENNIPKNPEPKDYFLFNYTGEIEKVDKGPDEIDNVMCVFIKVRSRNIDQLIAIPIEIIEMMDDNVLPPKQVNISFAPMKDPAVAEQE